jgi:hypothetical protein
VGTAEGSAVGDAEGTALTSFKRSQQQDAATNDSNSSATSFGSTFYALSSSSRSSDSSKQSLSYSLSGSREFCDLTPELLLVSVGGATHGLEALQFRQQANTNRKAEVPLPYWGSSSSSSDSDDCVYPERTAGIPGSVSTDSLTLSPER